MPSCKNCIHRDFCNIHGYIDADECGCFKDKADFVEVKRGNIEERLIALVDKAKQEYANDVTDHTETEYIVECLLNEGVRV